MKKLLVVLMLIVSALSLTISSAEARRLGGGGSFGRQSSGISRSVPNSPSQQNLARPAAPAATPGAAPKPASPWRGIVGGALLGLGLGAMMSHFGLGGAGGSLLMILLLAFVVIMVVRMVMRRNSNAAPAYPSAYSNNASEPQRAVNEPIMNSNAGFTPEIGSRIEPVRPSAFQTDRPVTGQSSVPWGIPADFDVPGFVRSAKTYFIRLQAAWDKADTNDIREFTSPEMFGELKMQLQERGASANNTDVVQLDGELMGIETVGDHYLASVKFSGLIKEAPEASAEPFTEVWNLSKPVSGQGGWILAGIQQVN
ncbi:Tim44 domain-containing protein [Glaciimonas immobilis]|uniref:Putative lipid-binding transport protein (Tim44 family) n=1 Tax=Glaciimonas immobilis TaxID=728004 RepID=A0A840RY73_9BURK|nr:Tim44-like domain-containing protein [Glaciimonas immobilis]KAF3998538.1 Tim44 domain-containing protein [Glaciimonas immobilis]MBB5201390.1 putative lipid-binding transport protein (Tim44 family) [Glaciimonas immobilis]